MAIKKHNIIILTISVIIAAVILVTGKKQTRERHTESRVYVVNGGWGYDILVDKKLFIRQESIPVLPTLQPFKTKEEAEQVAKLVMQKIESGQPPTLGKSDVEQMLTK
jgi:gentisate 1,2-dioxygenase